MATRRETVVRLTEVARRAGVSPSVASRTLNDDPSLRARAETRARVVAAARELGYHANYAARSLRLARTAAIGLIIPDVTNSIFAEVLRGVEDEADELRLHVLLGRAEHSQSASDYLRRLASERRVDGFLLQGRDEATVDESAALRESDLPIVLLNSRGRGPGIVLLDDVAGGVVATQHLIELGHRDIAFIGGDTHNFTSRRRERGYRQAMAATGQDSRANWVLRRGYAPEHGWWAAHEIFGRTGRRPSGIVVANINAAIGVILACRDLGVDVPRQVSVVGIHDTWMADYTSPSLTTVRMPLYELGRRGTQVLVQRMSGGEPTGGIVDRPAPVVVKRGSTSERHRPPLAP